MAVGAPALISSPAAWADDVVTYEVVSDHVGMANIEYQDAAGRISIPGAALPWRFDAVVPAMGAPPPAGSQVRADWRPSAAPGRWVTVRIVSRGKVICQSTLDIGDAACYGITRRVT
ncbi:hypothetical protein BST36_23520 [Mycolicibacterium moriokaense]|nr:hypothetical protein [Mycolicibacterium moriokaense]MCV7039151.1 hypothetical protein [Mycolicibacterium moriokaense]ORB18563.1 hypothetical protein BST36_23520 [Mycolicibacterium moriokaense]